MENEVQKIGTIYLNPNAFDLVLEAVAGLLLLFLWAIALGPFVFTESYTDRFEQNLAIIVTIGFSLLVVLYYRIIRFYRIPSPIDKQNTFIKITQENAERQYRLYGRAVRLTFIVVLMFLIGASAEEVVPLKSIHLVYKRFFSIDYMFFCFVPCFAIWLFVRSWMLR